jgi:hypothetical protein
MDKGILLWDVDGTLIQSTSSQSVSLHRRALGDFGTLKNNIVMETSGQTDWQVLQNLMTKPDLENAETSTELRGAFQALDRIYGEDSVRHISLNRQPGITEDLFSTLKADWNLGVLTGNTSYRMKKKLEIVSLLKCFDSNLMFGCLEGETRKDILGRALQEILNLPKNLVVIIGDTPSDIEIAKAYSVRCVAVSTGNYAFSQLKKLNPDLAISNFQLGKQEFLEFLKSLRRI